MSESDTDLRASLVDSQEAGSSAEAVRRLGDLAKALSRAGLEVLPRYDRDPPVLRVVNPNAVGGLGQGSLMGENITARRTPAGQSDPSAQWHFHWSWNEPLHPCDDIAGAVVKISYVLAALPAGSDPT